MEEIRNKVQQEALKSWLEKGKIGTVEIITGLGKTFVSLHALYEMPKDKNVTHLFLAEATDRQTDLLKDIKKYKKIFGRDVLKDYNLEFYCYQTVYKWENKKFGLVIADEIHDSLTPQYSKFFYNNDYEAIIGLSATINTKTSYELKEDDFITKGDLLNEVAPICFTYDVDTAMEDGTARKINVYVIQHKLDSTNKTIKSGNKKKSFMQTEKAAYDYWDSRHKKSWYIQDKNAQKLQIRITSTRRSQILYNLESKIPVVKKLLEVLNNKTIIFGNSIDSLLKVTPNTISSRNSDKENKDIRDAFENGKINSIGSFKKLKQGANLDGENLDNCIIMSYYSTDKDLIQRIGRLRNNGKVGNLFIILTMGTQEEQWFSKMFDSISSMNMTYCPDVDFAIKKYLEKNDKGA